MATNVFFNQFEYAPEQNLMNDLIVEMIQIHGVDFVYIPRDINNKDEIYNADDISSFTDTYPIEMYVLDYQGFQGDGNILSKFGVEIRDQIRFAVARSRFEEEVTASDEAINRPREGDLIYYPLNKKLFEIKFVNDKPTHYPMGVLQVYELTTELYEYSEEQFDTGYEEIDNIQKELSHDLLDYAAVIDDDGNVIVDDTGRVVVTDDYDLEKIDPLANNDDFEENVDDLIDFTETNPFSEPNR